MHHPVMKSMHIFCGVLSLLIVLTACSGAPAQTATPSPTPAATLAPAASPESPGATGAPAAGAQETARAYLQLLIDGAYAESEAYLDATMHEQIKAMGGTEAFFGQLLAQSGAISGIEGEVTAAGEQDGYSIFTAVLSAEAGLFNAVVYVDAEVKIAGLNIMPQVIAEDPITMPQGFIEEPITVDAGSGYPLNGYLVKPVESAQPVAGVLLVQGSGALDYDETVSANRVFGKLARGLAEQGIATLRYDKRTYSYPEIMGEEGYTIQQEYVEDVLAAVALLRDQAGIDPSRIIILGHSQGGMLAPLFVDSGAEVAGMVLFAGTPRNMMDLMEDQQTDAMRYLEANGMAEAAAEQQVFLDSFKEQRVSLEAGTPEEALAADPIGAFPAYYLYDLGKYDAIATIKKAAIPTLILQGEKDMQVYAGVDYAMYEDALSQEAYVQMKLYPGLSHLFTPSQANSLMEAMAEYNTAAEIPQEIFEDIAVWIESIS